MSFETEAARRYRVHAARLRAMRTTHNDPDTIEALAGVAESYDRMARTFDDVSIAIVTSPKTRTFR